MLARRAGVCSCAVGPNLQSLGAAHQQQPTLHCVCSLQGICTTSPWMDAFRRSECCCAGHTVTLGQDRGMVTSPTASRSIPTTVVWASQEGNTVILQSRKGKFEEMNMPGPRSAAGLEWKPHTVCLEGIRTNATKAMAPTFLPPCLMSSNRCFLYCSGFSVAQGRRQQRLRRGAPALSRGRPATRGSPHQARPVLLAWSLCSDSGIERPRATLTIVS